MNTEKSTSDRIKQTLLHFMTGKPIYKIHVKELCAALGIGRSTFYAYYDSVYSVVQDIEDFFFEQFDNVATIQHSRVTTDKMIKKATYDLLSFYQEHLELIRILTSSNGDPSFRIKFSKQIKKRILATIPELSRNVNCYNAAATYVASGQLSMVIHWANHPDELSIDDIINIYLPCTKAVMLQALELAKDTLQNW